MQAYDIFCYFLFAFSLLREATAAKVKIMSQLITKVAPEEPRGRAMRAAGEKSKKKTPKETRKAIESQENP